MQIQYIEQWLGRICVCTTRQHFENGTRVPQDVGKPLPANCRRYY